MRARSALFTFGFVLFCLLALIKLVVFFVVGVGVIQYYAEASAANDIASRIIIALLVDFAALLLMWALNFGLRVYRKPTALVSLLAALPLLAMFVLSIVAVGYASGSTGETIVMLICWICTAAYLLLPDLFIARDIFSLRHGWPMDGEANPPTLSERIRQAKK